MIGLQPKMDPIGIWTKAIMLCVILKVLFKGIANKALAYKSAKLKLKQKLLN
jgi:hypothetical protein